MDQLVIDAIDLERKYQDNKWGTIKEHPHAIMEWIAIMRAELNEAENAWLKITNEHSLLEILQIISTGVACLEQHGVYIRDDFTEIKRLMPTPKPKIKNDENHVVIDKDIYDKIVLLLNTTNS